MSNVARIGTTEFATLAQASSAIPAGIRTTVEIINNSVGPAGFAAFVDGAGGADVTGVIQSDGTLPVLVALTGDRLAYRKAILNFEAGSHSVKDIKLAGAVALPGDGQNGAGIRVNPGCTGFVGRHFSIRGSEDGILTGDAAAMTIELSDFLLDSNGFGRDGYTHNAYFGTAKSVSLKNGTSINCLHGHDIKSRALMTTIENCHIEGSFEGRELDLSNGGILHSRNNRYIKHADAVQNNLIHIAPEGITDGRPEEYTSFNDHFEIGIPNTGRGLQFINNQGNKPFILTDPLFILAGVVISPTDAKPFLIGDVQVVLTGGVVGPLAGVKIGCPDDLINTTTTATAAAPVIVPVPAPVPAPAVVASPVVAPIQTPAPSGNWAFIGAEGTSFGPLPIGTQLRYGANGAYVFKTVSVAEVGTVSNTYFGSDPAVGVVKQAEQSLPIVLVVSVPIATIPTPVATPAVRPVIDAGNSSLFERSLVAGVKAFLQSYGYTVTK